MTRKACVLASGGFDSGVLLADLLERGHEVHPFYVRFGYNWEDAELYWLRRFPAVLVFSCLQARGTRRCGRCSKCAEHEDGLRAIAKARSLRS